MRSCSCWHRCMTDDALVKCPRMPLQLDELDRIVRFPAPCDGMGAIVAGLAIQATVSQRMAIQRLGLRIARAMAGGVVAAWLLQPGVGILRYSLHIAVAAEASHPLLGHDIAQATCLGPRMAQVAAIRGLGYAAFFSMFSMHRSRQAGYARHARRPERVVRSGTRRS